jgi:hypothetical protein
LARIDALAGGSEPLAYDSAWHQPKRRHSRLRSLIDAAIRRTAARRTSSPGTNFSVADVVDSHGPS